MPSRRAPTTALPASVLEVVHATGLKRLGVETRHLSLVQKQPLELAMVLAPEPALLLLGEPTAGLTKAEQHCRCIVPVEHDPDIVRSILLGGAVEAVSSETVWTIHAGAAHG